jgi:hypothetical protein
MRADITWDIDPAREAKVRCTARVDMPTDRAWNHLEAIRATVEEFTRMGVPDDAYVQFGQPTAWATWERPYTATELDTLRALRFGTQDHHGVVEPAT